MGCNKLSNPFYIDACGIQSEQTLQVYDYFYSNALLTANKFIIPKCNSLVTFGVSGLAKTYPGMYLWNETYGYLKIVSYNYSTCMLTVRNECQTVNASPGFSVPSCTVFLVVDTPCCFNPESYLKYPYLATDFVVPMPYNCTTVNLTNVYGIIAGQFVDISGGRYYVQQVINNESIVICNRGEGAIPLSVVYAKNSFEEYITPVTLYSQPVCDSDAAASGALAVCVGNLESDTLSSSTPGYVPVLVDATTNYVEFQDFNTAYALQACDWDLSDRATLFSYNVEEIYEGIFAALAGASTLLAELENTTVIENDTCSEAHLICLVDIRAGMGMGMDDPGADRCNMKMTLDVTDTDAAETLLEESIQREYYLWAGDVYISYHYLGITSSFTVSIAAGATRTIVSSADVTYMSGALLSVSSAITPFSINMSIFGAAI